VPELIAALEALNGVTKYVAAWAYLLRQAIQTRVVSKSHYTYK